MTASLAVTDPVLHDFAEDVGAADPVAVAGGRTRWAVGGALADDARILAAPTGIVAYAAPEMTVQVRAGTTVAELDAALASHGQRTALPDRGGTVGGAIAVGENAVETLGRGRLRDAVLQVRYVSAEGELVTGGGPVVKNVTGYNLPKLMTGSLGTLGLIAEVILRTNPIPAARQWLVASEVDPMAVADAVHAPGAVLFDGTSTWVLLEGHAPDLAAETAALGSVGSFAEADGPPTLPPHRWSLTPAAAAAFPDGRFVASIGVGTVWADTPQPARPADTGAAAIAARMKHNFDPTGRLNPGRQAGA
ncbi:MAG: FAD-binding protein [Acidimicrobiales bacterium]|nr:FAD-binding protein [Acidimicrobiales bacterium]